MKQSQGGQKKSYLTLTTQSENVYQERIVETGFKGVLKRGKDSPRQNGSGLSLCKKKRAEKGEDLTLLRM